MPTHNSGRTFSTTTKRDRPSTGIGTTLDTGAITEEDRSIVNRVYSIVQKRRREGDPTDRKNPPLKRIWHLVEFQDAIERLLLLQNISAYNPVHDKK
jgi:hypothetical protein